MEFWGNKINVSRESAEIQVSIYKRFTKEKRFSIALEFANFGVDGTKEWIKKNNPFASNLEINLEFVRLMYFESGKMLEPEWLFYKKVMLEKIRKDWISRFRKMMKKNGLSYDELALIGGFKNGNVLKSTISRGIPSFAKVAVFIYEKNELENGASHNNSYDVHAS